MPLAAIALSAPWPADAQGWLPEDPAFLATLPKAGPYRAWLPPSVDLSPDFPPPGDQGNQPSCVSWATAYALRSYLLHQTTGADLVDAGNRFNPVFIHARVAGSCQSGAMIGSALRFLAQVGAVPFRDLPETTCPDGAGAALDQRAAGFRIGGFHLVDATHPDDVKGELARRRPVVIGLSDTRAFHHLRGDEVYRDPPPDHIGGHAVVTVGYDESLHAFKIINSWGTGWGDGGFGWIDYDTFAHEVHAAFSADPPRPAPPNPVVAVMPPPAPPPRPAPAPQPAPDPLAALRAVVSRLNGELACGHLDLSAAGLVTGFVGGEADRTRAAAELAAIRRGTEAEARIDLRPWPECEALLTLAGPLTRADGLTATLEPADPPCPSATLCAGDSLVASVRMPHRSGYLYVAYIQAEGDVLIMAQPRRGALAEERARGILPLGGGLPEPRRPNEMVTLGRGADQPGYRISAPFGHELLLAIAAAAPLFEAALPETMTEREFLTMLRASLLRKPRPTDPDRVVAAATLSLTTAAR